MKKRLAIVLCLVMCLTMALPFASNAAEFKDNLYFNADFREESFEESTGKFTYKVIGNGEIGFNEEETCFNSKDPAKASGIKYTIKDGTVNLGKAFTLETYVFVRELKGQGQGNQEENYFMRFGEEKMIFADHNGTWAENLGFCMEVDGGNNGCYYQSYADSCDYKNQWAHVVAVFDNGEIKVYVDGELAVEEDSGKGNGNVDFANMKDIWVGCRDDEAKKALNGYIAYARAYTAAATEGEVKALYEAREDMIEGGAPSTPAPTKKPDDNNPGTFDMGILSLAAVALSSTALLKKREANFKTEASFP